MAFLCFLCFLCDLIKIREICVPLIFIFARLCRLFEHRES